LEHTLGYDFFAFGDIDVMYGNIRRFLSPAILAHDLITFNASHVAGHLTLLRNTPAVSNCYQHCEDWRRVFAAPDYVGIDENRGYYGIEKVHATESQNTPLSPYIPWHDGTFCFPAVWFWRDGKVTNNLDGSREFPYLHFMRYKYLWRERNITKTTHVEGRDASYGWKVCREGIHPCSPGEADRITQERIRVTPVS
jgi:hypothetical protein